MKAALSPDFPKILKPTFGNYPLVPIFAVLFAERVYAMYTLIVESPEKQAQLCLAL
jgi:hypothetical protein